MRHKEVMLRLLVAFSVLALTGQIVHSQQKAAAGTVQVHLVITDQSFSDNGEIPVIRAENVQVKQGKNDLRVEHLIPARGDNAALQLFVLIDDTCDSSLGNNLDDLREFINAQPASTVVGVAYMSNATIQITQNFTADHALAAKAIRLPRGSSSAMDSPYLSLVSLVKGWPEQKVRREVLMVSDGIDRLRGDNTGATSGAFASPGRPGRTTQPGMRTMPTISSDADTASNASQRSGVIVHGIYSPGIGRHGRNAWEAQLGQSGVAKIADETGGEYFALGAQNPVSFKPYLERLQKIFNNQYYLVFQAIPRKKGGLQPVRLSTGVSNADLASANNVWVPASGG
ncbi:MAG TPA: hypothetical protein VJN92_10205 [Candidatus Acidoferrum sp.]|nr:hypothetical protein [Candidatus Acidoferrum sp.]